MKTRSVLVRFPGYPLALESLIPDGYLAQWAGCLLDAGHKTRILDYGTVEGLQRQYPIEGQDVRRRMADLLTDDAPLPALGALFTYWQCLRMDKAFRAQQASAADEVAQTLALRKALDFVVFRLVDDDDAVAAFRIAASLRALRPGLRIVMAGPVVDAFSESILDLCPAVNVCCVGDCERSLVRLAEKLNRADDWPDIPNLVFRRDGKFVHTARRHETELDLMPAPAYEPDIYPALASPGKLRLCSVEDSRGGGMTGHAASEADGALTLKSPSTIGNEIWRLGTQYGARAFHFPNAGTPEAHATAVAKELMTRGQRIVYSRVARPDTSAPYALAAWRASGCRALEMRIDSGSQRLLEDYFGHGYTVSQTEAIMTACRSVEMFTVAQFAYPTAMDDYHTEAETLRMISRTRPSAVTFGMPDPRPGSAWYERSAEFGFVLDKSAYFAQRLRCRRRFPLPAHRWPGLPFRVGRMSASEVIRRQEQIALAASQYSALLYFSGVMALWAHILGYVGREAEFHTLSRYVLLGEGVTGVSDWVTGFNDRASAATPSVGFRPLAPLKAAVGN